MSDSLEDTIKAEILRLAKEYAKAAGLSVSTVSRHAHGSDGFLAKWEAGKVSVTLRKADDMLRYLRETWPEGEKPPKIQTIRIAC